MRATLTGGLAMLLEQELNPNEIIMETVQFFIKKLKRKSDFMIYLKSADRQYVPMGMFNIDLGALFEPVFDDLSMAIIPEALKSGQEFSYSTYPVRISLPSGSVNMNYHVVVVPCRLDGDVMAIMVFLRQGRSPLPRRYLSEISNVGTTFVYYMLRANKILYRAHKP